MECVTRERDAANGRPDRGGTCRPRRPAAARSGSQAECADEQHAGEKQQLAAADTLSSLLSVVPRQHDRREQTRRHERHHGADHGDRPLEGRDEEIAHFEHEPAGRQIGGKPLDELAFADRMKKRRHLATLDATLSSTLPSGPSLRKPDFA
jgi:hypothetical protein